MKHGFENLNSFPMHLLIPYLNIRQLNVFQLVSKTWKLQITLHPEIWKNRLLHRRYFKAKQEMYCVSGYEKWIVVKLYTAYEKVLKLMQKSKLEFEVEMLRLPWCSLNWKLKTSWRKMVLGAAIGYYHYVPNATLLEFKLSMCLDIPIVNGSQSMEKLFHAFGIVRYSKSVFPIQTVDECSQHVAGIWDHYGDARYALATCYVQMRFRGKNDTYMVVQDGRLEDVPIIQASSKIIRATYHENNMFSNLMLHHSGYHLSMKNNSLAQVIGYFHYEMQGKYCCDKMVQLALRFHDRQMLLNAEQYLASE